MTEFGPKGAPAVRRLLHGAPGLAAGFSFVPSEAVASLTWGHPELPRVAAACCDLELDFAFVPAKEPGAASLAEHIDSCGTAVLWSVDGPLGRVASELGWARVIVLSATCPEDLDAALDRAVEAVAHEIASAPSGAVGCVIAEDLASNGGPLFPPDFVFENVLSRLGRLAELARGRGMEPIIHSDGDTRVFLHAMAGIGFDAIHVGGLDYRVFVELYGSARAAGLGVIGGLPGDDLRAGAPRAVEAGTRAGLLAEVGGLLVSDDGGLTTSGEVTALMAALGAARRLAAEGSAP